MARGRFFRGDAGNRSDGRCDSGGLEEHPSERAASRTPDRSLGRGIPDLLRHLLLALRKGVQSARDPDEMSRRIAIFEDVQHRVIDGDAEGLANDFGCPGGGFRERVHFDSIACGQEDEIGPRRSTSTRLSQGSVRGFPEEPLTRVEYQGRSCKLAELLGEDRRAIRYPRVLYQARERVPVDVVVYHDPEFQEPWWLLVPSQSCALLPVRTVVALYRERMQVEQSFRDFKTHLGLRGLRLKVDIAERTGRLLLAFTMAYCLALLLGVSREAEKARRDLEIPRRRPRHGSCRTLSVLYVALAMLSHPRWRARAYVQLEFLVGWVAAGRSLLRRAPPMVVYSHSAAA